MPAAVTVEMPFKDVTTNPDRFHGWSPERAQHFGAASLQAVHAVLCRLQQLDREEESQAGKLHLPLAGTRRRRRRSIPTSGCAPSSEQPPRAA